MFVGLVKAIWKASWDLYKIIFYEYCIIILFYLYISQLDGYLFFFSENIG